MDLLYATLIQKEKNQKLGDVAPKKKWERFKGFRKSKLAGEDPGQV